MNSTFTAPLFLTAEHSLLLTVAAKCLPHPLLRKRKSFPGGAILTKAPENEAPGRLCTTLPDEIL
jgi:hypothetical protein